MARTCNSRSPGGGRRWRTLAAAGLMIAAVGAVAPSTPVVHAGTCAGLPMTFGTGNTFALGGYQGIRNTTPAPPNLRSADSNVMHITLTGTSDSTAAGCTYQAEIDNSGQFTLLNDMSIAQGTYNITTNNITANDNAAWTAPRNSTGGSPNPPTACDTLPASGGPACATLYDSTMVVNGQTGGFYNVPCNLNAGYYDSTGTALHPGEPTGTDSGSYASTTFTVGASSATFRGHQVCSGQDNTLNDNVLDFLAGVTTPSGSSGVATPELGSAELLSVGLAPILGILYLRRRRRNVK